LSAAVAVDVAFDFGFTIYTCPGEKQKQHQKQRTRVSALHEPATLILNVTLKPIPWHLEGFHHRPSGA
jgi:hypothetical protein